MPALTIEGPKATKEAKKEIIEKVSKDVAEAYGLPVQSIVITIHECEQDNVGVGGKQLSEIEH